MITRPRGGPTHGFIKCSACEEFLCYLTMGFGSMLQKYAKIVHMRPQMITKQWSQIHGS